MTFQAKFTVQDIIQDVDVEAKPLVVRAVAEQGDISANTEGAVTSMELRIALAEESTVLKAGDIITAGGHFVGVAAKEPSP